MRRSPRQPVRFHRRRPLPRMSELASAQASTSPGIRGITLQDAGRGAAVAVAGSWVGYFLFTGMPQLTLDVFPRTIVVHILRRRSRARLRRLARGRAAAPRRHAARSPCSRLRRCVRARDLYVDQLAGKPRGDAAVRRRDHRLLRADELPVLNAANLAAHAHAHWRRALALRALGRRQRLRRLPAPTRSVEGLRASNIFPPTVPRVHDVSDHPNVLAMLLVLVMPFFALAPRSRARRAERVPRSSRSLAAWATLPHAVARGLGGRGVAIALSSPAPG